jgi:hypothetical protein
MVLIAPCPLNYLKVMAVNGSVRIGKNIGARAQNNILTCWKEEDEFFLYSVALNSCGIRERFYWLKF